MKSDQFLLGKYIAQDQIELYALCTFDTVVLECCLYDFAEVKPGPCKLLLVKIFYSIYM